MSEAPKVIQVPADRDIAMQQHFVAECWLRHYPKLALKRLDRSLTAVDDLYLEARVRRFREDEIALPAAVLPEPEAKLLKKYGIDDERDLLVHFTSLHLSDLGILDDSLTFLIGDLIKFDGDYYEITDQVRAKDGYWANSNVPLYIICACKRYRMGG